MNDIRYAIRTLRKSSGFAVTSVLVLALAIGANTAMFSVLNAVLFKPLPYPSPDRLVMLWTEIPSQNVREGRSAYWNVEQWRAQSKTFADIALYDGGTATLTSTDKAERISVVRATPNLLPLIGVQPLRGRIFSAEEADQQQRLALISYAFWQSNFGGSQDAIGSTLMLDGVPTEIIGIKPPTFQFNADVWVPHTMMPDWEAARSARGAGAWLVVGRLQEGVTREQAQAEMNAIARQLDEQMPAAQRNRGISIVPLSLQITGPTARLALWMLTAAVFCVLLIAASNVASLSLARSAGRVKEIAIRTAPGASRGRIIRQLLAESLTLAIVSGLLGLLVAVVGIRLIVTLGPGDLLRLNELNETGLDPQVLGWALGICLLTGVLVGLSPALTMARRNLRPSVDEGGRGIASSVTTRVIRRGLVVTEFALAIMLLVGAGLLMRSLWSVENVDLGFRPERVLTLQLSTTAFTASAQRVDFYNRVLEEIEALPGVESAGIVGDFFIGGGGEQLVTADGNAQIVSERFRFRRDEASGGFFNTAGVPLIKGRFFSAEDRPDSPPVAIVNNAMARRLWPGAEALGQRFKLGPADSRNPWFTVVGVVGDMRRQGLENEPIPQLFEPLAQNPGRLTTLLVRTSTDDPLKMAEPVQTAVHRVEKYVPAYGVKTFEGRLGNFLTQRRFQSSLLMGFSAIAMLMAAIGIYGLMQYS